MFRFGRAVTTLIGTYPSPRVPPSGAPETILDLIGDTPVLPLRRLGKDLPYRLLAKLEYLNPGGSVKDRIGTQMVAEAERTGRLRPGGTIVEATSGNTGVGLALIAAVRGYHSVFVLPDKMSADKVRLLRAYGARVVVTPSQLPPDHPMSHYSVARRLAQEIPGAYYPNQYENQGNPEAHYRTTGPEVDRQGGESLGAVITTIGTGGTVSGIGRYFKEHRPSVRVVAVDPKGSVLGPYFRTKEHVRATPYLVEGIGEDMIPKTVHFEFIDDFVEVGDRESFLTARRLAREEGLFAGGSSGAAVAGALRWLADRPLPSGSTVVVLLPDSGDRYLSKFYSDEWMREKGLLDDAGRAIDLVQAKDGVPALVSVEPTTVVKDALELLRRHDVSQLPVLSGTENVGSVTEEDILQKALADETVLERTVSAALGPPFPEVRADAPLGEMIGHLKESRAVLVRAASGSQPVGLLTRRDLFAFLTHPGSTHAV